MRIAKWNRKRLIFDESQFATDSVSLNSGPGQITTINETREDQMAKIPNAGELPTNE